MPLRALELPAGTAGRVWLDAMPGRDESWPALLTRLRKAGIDQVVCLTPLHEVAGLSPAYHAAIREGELPFGFIHLPMRNFGLALQAQEFQAGLSRVVERVRSGEDVMLHCAAGIGRTGTAAACLLKGLGLSNDEALSRVRAAGSDPESALQSGLIERF
jgi:hypothetical protein